MEANFQQWYRSRRCVTIRNGVIGYLLIGTDNTARKAAEEALHKAGALQRAIFNSANFSSIATDAKGVIQIFNVGAERMLGYAAADVVNKITPADISDPAGSDRARQGAKRRARNLDHARL
jgi:PAS domain-containing protein